MKNKGFTYIWYDKTNKRYYIGCHWGTEDDGYICSSPWMKRVYTKHPQDFKRRILKSNFTSKIDMYNEEIRLLKMIKQSEIKPYNSNPRYYNLNIRNNEVWHKYEENIKTVGQKISVAKKGKKTGARDTSVGVAISEAKKKSFSKRRKELDGYSFTPEHRKKISEVKKGIIQSEESKQKKSVRMKELYAAGQWSPFHGPLSEDHKKKISEALTGKPKSNIENYKGQPKPYKIIKIDNTELEIINLKQYGVENKIPYVTLFKAAQHGTKIPKYNIQTITRS